MVNSLDLMGSNGNLPSGNDCYIAIEWPSRKFVSFLPINNSFCTRLPEGIELGLTTVIGVWNIQLSDLTVNWV